MEGCISIPDVGPLCLSDISITVAGNEIGLHQPATIAGLAIAIAIAVFVFRSPS